MGSLTLKGGGGGGEGGVKDAQAVVYIAGNLPFSKYIEYHGEQQPTNIQQRSFFTL